MDSAPPGPPASADELPPEAIALAGRLFEAARKGQMDIFEQALPRGLSPNMTNEKGDSLVGILPALAFPYVQGLRAESLFRDLIASFTSTSTLLSTLHASGLHGWSSILPRPIKTLLLPPPAVVW
jgi:hypothetical protein